MKYSTLTVIQKTVNTLEHTGFEYDLVGLLAEDLGVELEIRPAFSLQGIFRRLQREEVDLAAAGLTLTQQRAEAFVEIISYRFVGKIEHKLMPPGHARIGVEAQNPVGVSAIKITVGIDHFRLNPKAEFHILFIDNVIDNWMQAVRVFIRVWKPIPQ